MKISYNWLKDFIQTDLSIEKTAEILTDIGLEVEGTENVGISEEDLNHFVVGEVVACEKHNNADKLKVTQVDLGNETVQIVCGAPNVAVGQKVPVATPGAIIKDDKGNQFEIKKAKLRGEPSNGMICSKKELRLSNDHAGIWEMDSNLEAGTPLSQILETNTDTIFEIGLTPNRADAMSHYGVARDLHAALKSRKLNVTYQSPEISDITDIDGENPFKVFVEESDLCKRYSGAYIQNVNVADSPQWLQKRLKSIGLYPKNNIVDITNYILHHVGQPMHAFDADKLEGNQIIVGLPYPQDNFKTLDQIERKLSGDELMIKDAKNNLGIAGVMGGSDSAVSSETKNIFLESAYFDPVTIRKTSKAHNINSDSSFRFERGIDPHYTVNALQIAIQMILDIAGGTLSGEIIDHYPTHIQNFNCVLEYHTIDKLLGERIHREKIKEILKSLDIEILTENPNFLELEIPAYRVDVQREADLIEEIIRIYGFNAIATHDKVSFSVVKGEGYQQDKLENILANTLVNHGFHEAMNLSMYKKEYNLIFGFDDENSVELLNPLSSDLAYMRRSLLPSLLENIDYNIKRKQENIRLFEFGQIYKRTQKGYRESRTLSIVITGNQFANSWNAKNEKVNLFYLKGIIQQMLQKLGNPNLTWEIQDSQHHQQLVGKINQNSVIKIGQFTPHLLKSFDIDEDVYYAEFHIYDLIKNYSESHNAQFRELPKFPSVKRDLALLVDKEITFQKIVNNIHQLNISHIKNIDLFDVYEGDNLPNGKKSYAISLLLQDENKTMTDKEIEKIITNVVQKLKNELKVELR